jgi:hypothetical protein
MGKKSTPSNARKVYWRFLVAITLLFLLGITDRFFYDIPGEWGNGKWEICFWVAIGYGLGFAQFIGFPKDWEGFATKSLVYEEE